jgi:beta-lactamase regulating signal transducer with metallopeptidase domain
MLHEEMQTPLTFGVTRPAIILPTDSRRWSNAELRRALLHELEHVRRNDWVVRLAVRVACVLYWFHPLVWVAWRRLRLETERASDDAVIQSAADTDYADQLVALAQRMLVTRAQHALDMANRSDLSARVMAILDANRRRVALAR